MASTSGGPWWLGGGELCPFCEQRYAYAVEVRCVDCDRPMCPVCVVRVRVTRERYCPECQSGGAGRDRLGTGARDAGGRHGEEGEG